MNTSFQGWLIRRWKSESNAREPQWNSAALGGRRDVNARSQLAERALPGANGFHPLLGRRARWNLGASGSVLPYSGRALTGPCALGLSHGCGIWNNDSVTGHRHASSNLSGIAPTRIVAAVFEAVTAECSDGLCLLRGKDLQQL